MSFFLFDNDNFVADVTAEVEMNRYINALNPIIDYIDNLYISRNITLDW